MCMCVLYVVLIMVERVEVGVCWIGGAEDELGLLLGLTVG